ncbi:hypothetical protein BSL78_21825 [Apostichopus japonicus]|uniref:Ig-like domain-containing protein n=1 Tax=Stichopus japonicus TaxID=307972 RepID=A0A2G8JZY2_STIJA|nr:hypothetical protein BSL78_21825 [Apostichopus japonicus]
MYQLVVLVPPTIVPGEEQQTAYVEEAVRLSCEHDGFPQPTVMWMKGEEKVNTQNRLKYFLSPTAPSQSTACRTRTPANTLATLVTKQASLASLQN